ncbi:SPOR domain-containing protein [Pelagibius sp.]|uniref:SPOR domain-containing protein n=1 Tax=Pelagibius sp. TaxID=1931238 RepID=UPI003B50C30E
MLSRGPLTGGLALALLAGCTIEMGPPPDSDPPLVSEAQQGPPPPAQPTEPQAWSRDLDFDGGERRFERGELAEGLVAEDQPRTYSAERLTFESAQSTERPPTEAELIRERARQRLLEARGQVGTAAPIAPPSVAAAPVETVSAEALPPQGAGPAGDGSAQAAAVAETVTQQESGSAAGSGRQRPSLPPPPVMPAQAPPAEQPVPQEPPTQVAAVEPRADSPQARQQQDQQQEVGAEGTRPEGEAAPGPQTKLSATEATESAPRTPAPAAQAAMRDNPAADQPTAYWDAPKGTILVQISAIQDQNKVAGEWDRLKRGYPEVLGPLRLVVEEAKLGDRGVFFRVQAGGFASETQAENACTLLTERGQPCFVVERP